LLVLNSWHGAAIATSGCDSGPAGVAAAAANPPTVLRMEVKSILGRCSSFLISKSLRVSADTLLSMRSACATAFSESRPLLLRPPDTILTASFVAVLFLDSRQLHVEGLALTRLERDECIAAAKARHF
jgi:hypothetical protein